MLVFVGTDVIARCPREDGNQPKEAMAIRAHATFRERIN